MSVVADYPDWSAHVATADQVAATGVPLLTKSGQLLAHSGSLSHASPYQSAILPVSQIGYEWQLQTLIGNTATDPFVELTLQWTDSVSGQITGYESYYPVCSSNGNGFMLIGRGPTKGDRVQVTITSEDPLVASTIAFTLLQNSRIYQKDYVFGNNNVNNLLSIPAYNQFFGPDDPSVLAMFVNQTVTAANNINILCSMAPGRQVQLAGNTAGVTPGSVVVTVFAENPSVFTGGAICLRETLTTAAINFDFLAPNAMLRLNIANTATSGTLTVSGMMVAGS